MKTTVEISDEILIEAKKWAAELRIPLRRIIEEALRKELDAISEQSSRKPAINWVTVDGGVPTGLDLTDRESMGEWLTRARSE